MIRLLHKMLWVGESESAMIFMVISKLFGSIVLKLYDSLFEFVHLMRIREIQG